jgi:hypothetical protein
MREQPMPQRERVFISYCHKDAGWLERVREQLAVLEGEGLISIFDDTLIGAGEDWYARLDQEMLRAKLAVLLVSAPFLNSNFIRVEEIPRLFDKHAEGGMKIYPILVEACSWKQVKWLARLQLRPPGAKPISSLRRAACEQVLANVADEIASLVGAPMPADQGIANDVGAVENLRVPKPSNGKGVSDVEMPIELDPIGKHENGGRIFRELGEGPSVKGERRMETHFINSFAEYCENCAEMMTRATGDVRTVQTPSRGVGSSIAFRKYLRVTADKIVQPSGPPTHGVTLYRRLVVVDAASFESESGKLAVFFDALHDALARATKDTVGEVDLSCLELCIVHRDTMSQFFHSNLDVHITAANECALAFQRPQTGQTGVENLWQTCLYASLGTQSDAERLIQSFDEVWSQGAIKGGEVLAQTVGSQEEDLRAIKRRTLRVLKEVAYGHMDLPNPKNSNVRTTIEKSAAYSNLFFTNAKTTPVPPQMLAPLVREWYAITRAFALQTPQYVALVAKECQKIDR